MAAAATVPLTTSVYADSLAQRELARRRALVNDSDIAFKAGRVAHAEQDYETAVSEYRRALNLLPNGPITAERRAAYNQHLGDASVEYSKTLRKVGKRDEARDLLEEVTAADPSNIAADTQLEYLDDPIRTNPALDYEHTKAVDSVRKLLYTAEGYYNLGKFDAAEATYQDVIRIDRYNRAARRGMERVTQAKSDYYRSAYDHTRAALLTQVDSAWELAVPTNDGPPVIQGDDLPGVSGGADILAKLRSIILDSVTLEDISVEDAIDYLRQRAFELDTDEPNPSKRGINFVIQGSGDGAGAPEGGLGLGDENVGSARIASLKLRNVPIEFALKQITEQANLGYDITEFAVTIVPKDSSIASIITRTFRVPPDFLESISGGGSGGGASDDPFGSADGGGGAIAPRGNVQDLLTERGVGFGDNASASLVGNGSLVVKNTPTNIDLIDQIVAETVKGAPKMIKILTKFVEVSQENTDELGFDWLITPFGLNGDAVFLGGGTQGSGSGRQPGDFINRVDNRAINPSATGGTSTTQGILTAANRSGDFAIDSNSIDAVLNNPNRSAQASNVAPGILSLTGLFTDGQVQVIMRGLQQKRGTDIMTAPSVLAKSGQVATIEIIREFIYPTEYEPPELPNRVGIGGGFGGGGIINPLDPFGGGQAAQSAGIFPVTPATPTAFETRNTGVTLEIEPTLGADDYTINLRFVPEIVEFEGFVNYGSPIQSPGTDAFGNPSPVTITENRIEQPVFSARRVNTSLTIYDGHTVAVGGLMREDVQNVEDQVPILGDIPVIGRLFQTKSENRIKSNLIIFVTAEIIDPTGRRLQGGGISATEIGGGKSGSGLLPELGS